MRVAVKSGGECGAIVQAAAEDRQEHKDEEESGKGRKDKINNDKNFKNLMIIYLFLYNNGATQIPQ